MKISLVIFRACYYIVCIIIFQIYPDPDAETEVLMSTVRCKYYPKGCHWMDKACNLQVSFNTFKCSTRLFMNDTVIVCDFKWRFEFLLVNLGYEL